MSTETPRISETVQQTETIVDLTDAAAEKLKKIIPDLGVRVAVKGGGCAGLEYDLKPESTAGDLDIVQQVKGLTLYLNPLVVPYLRGVVIDYTETLMESGFKFRNPNAVTSCGCGTSFGVAPNTGKA